MKMKAAPTLLCIPDISGFTKFMSDTNFELSSKVIPSLLNKIVYSNEIGLKISEIEGDAVLFYLNGELPSLKDVVSQCKFFYTEFYKQLHALRARYNKDSDSDMIPKMLGLKIILHYGKEVGLVPVGKRIKLIGEDVITAHRLLKNNIKINEYILLSEDLLLNYDRKKVNGSFDWSTLKDGELEVEHIGTIRYSYINLAPLST
jgi:hypothetical protein